MRRYLLLLFAVGCGSRTGLSIGSSGPPPPPPRGSDAAPPVGPQDCHAAVLAGAPAPMPGYCSTRAYRTSSRLPSAAPTVAWQIAPPVPLTYSAIDIVVDDRGRSYATVQTRDNDAVQADSVDAFDADGTLAWTHSFMGAAPSALFLAADGTLHLRTAGSPPSLVVMTRDGVVSKTTPLPDNQIQDFAIGEDGSLYTKIADTQDSMSVAKLAADGSLVWKSPSFALCSLGASPIALAPGDVPIFIFATTHDSCTTSTVAQMVSLASDGTIAWQHDFSAPDWAIDPGIAPDGTIRVGLAPADTMQPLHLESLDASGAVLWDTNLESSGINVWESAMPIDKDGTAYARTNGGVVAVSASGTILWTWPGSPSFAYDAVVDESGVLAINDGDTVGLDIATGSQRWSFEGGTPTPPAVAPPFVAGLPGSIGGTLVTADQTARYAFFLAKEP